MCSARDQDMEDWELLREGVTLVKTVNVLHSDSSPTPCPSLENDSLKAKLATRTEMT